MALSGTLSFTDTSSVGYFIFFEYQYGIDRENHKIMNLITSV